MSSLQSLLQQELSLNGQSFDIFDERGMTMTTDGDLRDAIERGASLAANLSDASVHYIENRREELSQLQWKLMRDQVSGVAEKLLQVGHRVQELSESVTTMRHEHEEACRRMRGEMETLVESAKASGKNDLVQLAERVEAVSASVSSERSRREVAKQNTEQQMQAFRDMLSNDRCSRRTELAATNGLIEESRQAILEEGKSREAIEARRVADVAWLSDRIEVLAKSQADKVQDLCEQVKTVAFDVHNSLQDGTRSVLQVQSIAESTKIESTSRLKQLEDRILAIDNKVGEIGNREVLHYDEMQTKHRKMYAGWQELILDDRSKGSATRRLQPDEVEDLPKTSGCGTTSTPGSVLISPPPARRSGASISVGPARGSSARSLSPPMSLQATTTTVPAYSGRETSSSPPVPLRRVASIVAPSIGSASVPVAIVGLQSQQVLLQGGSAVAEGAALGERRNIAAPPAALRLAPRSVSPVARLRINGQLIPSASQQSEMAATAQAQSPGYWVVVPQEQGNRTE
jgi:hypothetical protein